VYLVEAADDICYSIVDLEDAQRLRILSKGEAADALLQVICRLDVAEQESNKTYGYFKKMDDANEAIAFLRARVINLLTHRAAEVFHDNTEAVLTGTFNDTLLDVINAESSALHDIHALSVQKIYSHDTVIQIELAGYNVMSELLQLFVPALLKSKLSHREQSVLKLMPYQFTEFEATESKYEKVLSALDFISGMTDEYATELYRRLKGIVIPRHG
jgi:dGTPase